jgi:hypothetical protein
MAGERTACLRVGYGCTMNGESVRLSRSGLCGDIRSLELPDVSGSTGIGSGVKRFRSRTVERLIELAATARVKMRKLEGKRVGVVKPTLTFIQFQLHFRYGADEALQIVGRFRLLPALRRRHVDVHV